MKLLVRAFLVLSCIVAMMGGLAGAAAARDTRVVTMRDRCDTATFDAVLGEGACDPAFGGNVTFERFLGAIASRPDSVLRSRNALGWRFSPADTTIKHGERLVAVNRGGEFHTFTEVAAFGGGCVDELNELLGLHPVAECADGSLFATTGALPGGEVEVPPLDPGRHHFICLIHPWMRTSVTVR